MRRHAYWTHYELAWERVIFNRKTQEIESSIIAYNNDKTAQVIERSVVKSEGDESIKTSEVFDTMGCG